MQNYVHTLACVHQKITNLEAIRIPPEEDECVQLNIIIHVHVYCPFILNSTCTCMYTLNIISTYILFTQVIWKKLYHSKSSRDHSTLNHFGSLLGRLPAARDPKKDMTACTELLTTVLRGHYLLVACSILGIETYDDVPSGLPDTKGSSPEAKRAYICDLAGRVVEQCGLIEDALLLNRVEGTTDGVYNYSRVFCHYGSLALEFMDAWAEGDGERVCRCWKVLLLHFRDGGRTKYAWEALRLLFQLNQLSPSLAHQLKWGRFINTKGGAGHNIPCDLHNEHINRTIKDIVNNMGGSLTEQAVRRAGQSVTMIHHIACNFDRQSGVPYRTSAHTTRSEKGDIQKVTLVLQKSNVLCTNNGRAHTRFPNMPMTPLPSLNKDKLVEWIQRKHKQ